MPWEQAEVMKLPVVISTLEGDLTASPGDWIIRGVKGEFYPCKPDIFEATYEAQRKTPEVPFSEQFGSGPYLGE